MTQPERYTDPDVIEPDNNQRHWDALATTKRLSTIDALADPFANVLAKLLGTLIQRHGRGGACQECRWQPVPLQPVRICDDLISAWKSAEAAQSWMNSGYPRTAPVPPRRHQEAGSDQDLGSSDVVRDQHNAAVARSLHR